VPPVGVLEGHVHDVVLDVLSLREEAQRVKVALADLDPVDLADHRVTPGLAAFELRAVESRAPSVGATRVERELLPDGLRVARRGPSVETRLEVPVLDEVRHVLLGEGEGDREEERQKHHGRTDSPRHLCISCA